MATARVTGPALVRRRFAFGTVAIGSVVALASIWVGVFIASVFAPDMITGSAQEHLAIASLVALPVGAVASAMVLLAAGVSRRDGASSDAWLVYGVAVAICWLAVGLVSVFATPMVTGTDPTTIPLAAIVAPVFGLCATAFASIYIAGAGSR